LGSSPLFVVWFRIFLFLGCCSFSAQLCSFLFPGLFLRSTLLVSGAIVLGVSPFPASIDAGTSLTGLAIHRASRCGCQFSRHQKQFFCCPRLFLPRRSVLSGRNVRGGAAVVLPLFEDGQPMCSPAP
jgi:hypothetical protein